MAIFGNRYQTISMPVGTLIHEKHKWDNYPSCQREYVWDTAMKRRLVDTILRGLYIPNLVAVIIRSDVYGRTYGIVDGQQRLRTILSFANNEFKTATNRKSLDEPSVPLIEANKLYRQLPQGFKQQFDDYLITITLIDAELDDETIGLQFRRLNYQRKLTFAEKLFSYNTQTKEFASELLKHPFWEAHLIPIPFK